MLVPRAQEEKALWWWWKQGFRRNEFQLLSPCWLCKLAYIPDLLMASLKDRPLRSESLSLHVMLSSLFLPLHLENTWNSTERPFFYFVSNVKHAPWDSPAPSFLRWMVFRSPPGQCPGIKLIFNIFTSWPFSWHCRMWALQPEHKWGHQVHLLGVSLHPPKATICP